MSGKKPKREDGHLHENYPPAIPAEGIPLEEYEIKKKRKIPLALLGELGFWASVIIFLVIIVQMVGV